MTSSKALTRWDLALEQTQEDIFWLPYEVNLIDRPELMVLHSTRDHLLWNTVLRVRSNPANLDALIDEVTALHQGRRSRWQLTPSSATGALERALTRAGYTPSPRYYGNIMPVDQYEATPNPRFIARRVEDLPTLLDFEDIIRACFQGKTPLTQAELERELKNCTGPQARTIRVVIYDTTTQSPSSCGGLNLYPKLRFGFLWAGSTLPHARGQGAYTALMHARIKIAAQAGMQAVGLYAHEHTSAPIVAAQGFTRGAWMRHWDSAK